MFEGLNRPVLVTAGLATATATISRAAPVVLSISPQSVPAVGNIYTVIIGQFFGVSGVATIGGLSCASSVWSHTRIVCLVPANVGANLTVQVCTNAPGAQCGSSPTVLFSYDRPRVDSVSPSFGVTQGGTVVVVLGANFGSNASVSFGALGSCVRTSFVQSDSQIECVALAGAGYCARV